MKTKTLLFGLFLLVAAVQLYIPAEMISHNESIIQTGTVLKFKCEPIDPYDPFQGKFIYLNFSNRTIRVDKAKNYEYNQKIYATFKKDAEGYAIIDKIYKKKPTDRTDFLELIVDNINNYDSIEKITLEYPFNRFYMNEYKAPLAEQTYVESVNDIKKSVYAEVAIKNGTGVIKEVMIDNVSIKDYVQKLPK
jgi:uncharacterized membrane-anchored protein